MIQTILGITQSSTPIHPKKNEQHELLRMFHKTPKGEQWHVFKGTCRKKRFPSYQFNPFDLALQTDWGALHLAAVLSNINLIDLLLENGADLELSAAGLTWSILFSQQIRMKFCWFVTTQSLPRDEGPFSLEIVLSVIMSCLKGAHFLEKGPVPT